MNKFGRFPHRNELLGRESTPEEVCMEPKIRILFLEIDVIFVPQEQFLKAIKSHANTSVVFNEDGTVERSDEDEGLDNAISAMLVNKF